MRIVFIGCVDSSSIALRKLLAMGCDVVGVVTKSASAFNADFCDLGPLCADRGIPCLSSTDLNSADELRWLSGLAPDAIVCVGWSSLLKRDVLNLPPRGVVGYHPAALPHNRGRHPIIWALALGLEETASTFFLMDEGADSGNILSQRPLEIALSDTAQSLYGKLMGLVEVQLEEVIEKLQAGAAGVPQDLSRGNVWRKRTKFDGQIDFRMSSRGVYNLVRALTRPYPGAHLVYKGQEITVWKAAEAHGWPQNLEPGKVLNREGSKVTIKCGEGAIELLEHEFSELPQVGEYV